MTQAKKPKCLKGEEHIERSGACLMCGQTMPNENETKHPDKKIYHLDTDDKFHLINCDHEKCKGGIDCLGKMPCDFQYCSECCEHDIDNGICLNCEKDFREELAAQTYDRWKDEKYDELVVHDGESE